MGGSGIPTVGIPTIDCSGKTINPGLPRRSVVAVATYCIRSLGIPRSHNTLSFDGFLRGNDDSGTEFQGEPTPPTVGALAE